MRYMKDNVKPRKFCKILQNFAKAWIEKYSNKIEIKLKGKMKKKNKKLADMQNTYCNVCVRYLLH